MTYRILLIAESMEDTAKDLRVQANTLEAQARFLRGVMNDSLEPAPAKHGRKWTDEDDRALLGQALGEMANNGLRGDALATELARVFDRSPIAVAARLVKLGAWG